MNRSDTKSISWNSTDLDPIHQYGKMPNIVLCKHDKILYLVIKSLYWSRLTVVNREAKEEVPYDGLSMNAREYFTRTNLIKIKNGFTNEPQTLALQYSR